VDIFHFLLSIVPNDCPVPSHYWPNQKEHVMQNSSKQKPDLKAVAAVAAKAAFVTPGMSFRPE
jgi:hypothetical protein